MYVILSVSEISHNQSEKYILCGNSPSREIATALRASQRQLNFRVIASVSVAIPLKKLQNKNIK